MIFLYKDPEARKALAAHQRMRELAFNAKGKMAVIKEILSEHPNDKILLFSESIDFVEQVSERFLIPVVTSKTPVKERKWILSAFKNNVIRIIAAGKVLDEGIDVASANIGIVISGTGQTRQFIQRLGRLLRPSDDKETAILYEIVTTGTSEVNVSSRRQI